MVTKWNILNSWITAIAIGILSALVLQCFHPDTDLEYGISIAFSVSACAFVMIFIYNHITTKIEPTKIKRQSHRTSSFQVIRDKYSNLNEVSEAICKSGLESCNLIIGIDYTKSNDFQGHNTFNNKSLHHIDVTGEVENPYQQVGNFYSLGFSIYLDIP